VRQLADVALKALSPGINDPTTAYDALAHMATVVGAILASPSRGRVLAGDGDRHIVDAQVRSDEDTVRLAFDEVRVAAMGAPTVTVYLLDVIRSLIDALSQADRPGAVAELRRQATLALQGSTQGELLAADRERVEQAHERWFT
jgi:uncharacterized membrane protein